jgi:hypothetical protein
MTYWYNKPVVVQGVSEGPQEPISKAPMEILALLI